MSSLTPPTAVATGPTVSLAIWRYRLPVMLLTVLAGIIGYYISSALPPVYETTATILLSDAGAFNPNAVDLERKVQQEVSRITSRAVVGDVAERLDSETSLEGLRERVTIEADPEIGLLSVTAEADDGATAAQIANAFVRAYEEVTRQTNLQRVESATEVLQAQVDELRSEIERTQRGGGPGEQQRAESLQAQVLALETRIIEIQATAAVQGAGIAEVEEAVPPEVPARPRPLRNAVVAAAFGFVISSALAYWRAGLVDQAKLDPTDILAAPLLAEIPDFGQVSGSSSRTPVVDRDASEAYQFLLASFEYALAQSGARSVLVTSASAGDGKSLTALHLARGLVIQGRNAVLVDSDVRGRGLTQLLHAEDQPGLVGLAEGDDLDNVVKYYRISYDVRLPVIPAGQAPPQPTGLLASERYREAIAKIAAFNDLTIIDGTPMLSVADAAAVAAQVDGLLLVIDAHTPQADVWKLSERLRLTATPLLGYVLNRVPDLPRFEYPYGGRHAPSRGRLRRLLRSVRRTNAAARS